MVGLFFCLAAFREEQVPPWTVWRPPKKINQVGHPISLVDKNIYDNPSDIVLESFSKIWPLFGARQKFLF